MTREFFLAIWIALTLMIVFYLLGKFQMTHDSPVERIGAARATLATSFLGLAVWMTAGLFGMKLGELDAFIPPRIYPGTTEPSFALGGSGGGGDKGEHLTWIEDYDAAMAEAKKRNVPLFLDFTGDQCTNCRLMEQNIFPRPEIQALLGQFVRAKLVTDRKSGPDRERSIRYVKMQEERFQTASLPFYVILSPNDEVIATFDGLTRDAAAYAEFLKKGTGGKTASTPPAAKKEWGENLDAAMAEAKQRNVQVFVDFTGDNCVNCRWMEQNMFPRPEIDSALKNYVRVKLFTDRNSVPNPEGRQLSRAYGKMQFARFGTVSMPYYAILSPENDIIATFDGLTRDPVKYEAFVKRGIETAAR